MGGLQNKLHAARRGPVGPIWGLWVNLGLLRAVEPFVISREHDGVVSLVHPLGGDLLGTSCPLLPCHSMIPLFHQVPPYGTWWGSVFGTPSGWGPTLVHHDPWIPRSMFSCRPGSVVTDTQHKGGDLLGGTFLKVTRKHSRLKSSIAPSCRLGCYTAGPLRTTCYG